MQIIMPTVSLYLKEEIFKKNETFIIFCWPSICTCRSKLCGDDMFEVSHESDTKGRNNAQQVFQRLTQTHLLVSFAGLRVWNALPPNIQNSVTLEMFKRQVNEYYLARYNE